MSKLIIGILASEKEKKQNILKLFQSHFSSLNFEMSSIRLEDIKDIENSLKEAKIDIAITLYQTVIDQSLFEKSFLYTSLPNLKMRTDDSNKLIMKSPFGRNKLVIQFLRNRTDIIRHFNSYFGKVWLIGAGAGNKELITIKGQKRVKEADAIISDFLLDQNILKSYVNENALIIPLTKYGARTKKNKVSQDEINESILRYALLEKKVVRLKGGDPFVFGRGGEECEYLLPYHIKYEIIPGITAMLSALCYSGIPLTHRDYNGGFIAITGYRKECEETEECHERISKKVNFALANDLIAVMFMALSNWKNFHPMIKDQEAPVALIESGAYPKQKVYSTTVKEAQSIIDSKKLKSPTLIAVGENVRVRDHLKWFENLPLYGVKILSFASRKLSVELEEVITDLGGYPKSFELYDLIPKRLGEVEKYFTALSSYDYLIISSRNAFDFFMIFLSTLDIDVRAIPKVIVTGKKTEEDFRKIGLIPDIVPRVFSSDGVIDELSKINIKDKKFLFPKSSLSKGVITSYILEKGGHIDDFVLYENVAKDISEETIEEIQSFEADYIVFTSSSSVNYFFQTIDTDKMNFTAIPIGSKTLSTLKKKGVTQFLKPEEFTIEGIRELLLEKHSG